MVQTEQTNADRVKIAKSFGSASKSYDVSARLQRFSGKHLMPWLPNRHDLTVLDLGSGTGFFTDLLAGSYEQVIGLDISTKMLNFAKEHRNKKIIWLEADAHDIPLKDNSIDFIYSNLVIQWFEPLDEAITEMLRVLKPGGLLIFTTLVDGTLHELKSSWRQVDDDQHVIDFKTVTELNTLFNNDNGKLVEQKCQDIILEYQNVIHLARELKGLGANHLAQKKNRGLSGKDKWFKMTEHYKDFLEPSGIYPATYRLFSGLVVKLNN
ncbi:malonyl-[acyl-carrier protein] O-methyltransferase BioC [Colwellia sp. MT41]|uniref:Malonyl-[acyl-carrier protein] O-methyltransferase n=1 Tax=Colwellia marinimaniae TaxID=1513592 RepID=A0ABQ0MVN2_9GAMM|nr:MULTISPECIES: malonyl-ACP O-methyltransferase BioC [Colwellia]ALO34847.1 malonyl-[acyl-carrier protein] O-methyltransferase BioC [Colwellia sp. MT41]GAW96432.1 malonyl-[acyl-carrier protein] O-methyltransferase [Colwellia marinimaniae]